MFDTPYDIVHIVYGMNNRIYGVYDMVYDMDYDMVYDMDYDMAFDMD